MPTLTAEQQEAIRVLVNSMDLTRGRGTKEAACSIAAINLALTGELTDDIPECMSEVIGTWVIITQDALPSQLRNSEQWKFLLPEAAGTGREFEAERIQILIDWFWEALVPEAKLMIENSFIKDNAVFMAQWEKALKSDVEMCEKAAMDVYLFVKDGDKVSVNTAFGISSTCLALRSMLVAISSAQNPPTGLPPWYKDVEHFRCVQYVTAAQKIAEANVNLLWALMPDASVNKDEEELAFWQRINPAAVLKKMIDVTRT